MASETDSATDQRGNWGSDWFWRILAAAIFISVLWILWLLWQITPKSNVNPIVFQLYQNRQSSAGVIQPVPGSSEPAAPAPAEPSAIGTGAPMETLKVETELKLQKPPAPPAK